MKLDNLFNYKTSKEIAKFQASKAMNAAGMAIDANAMDIETANAVTAFLNGVPVSIAAVSAFDISADATGDAVGTIITTAYDQYFVLLANASGTLSLWKAGVQAANGTAVLKIPAFDPATYVCLGVMLIANDSGSDLTVGTTALTGDVTFYDVVGPVFPHEDNIDKN
jgi:hypothetical protein